MAVYVGRKVAHRGRDSRIQRASICQVAAQAHARGADATVAGRERVERRDGEGGVFIVRG